ncbi:tripartite tricarboxylate transporter substrate binding protein [Roseomonas sp. JC162]|uniref:Tripartite tricarboxylate transporter substrate binding protein n=1 Tax=Neoroseomonas marina TaxID=1232220 RepID=A0A848EDW8_9PROT|nr:tripartite tricarboxylate transporter substrate binding protein [Neoroseomonas marina]NMJ41653.1 tripartite tricarboxylate transporter substrate binding protein [Neoroseomonas marina]
MPHAFGRRTACGLGFAGLLARRAAAQGAWPERPVRLIISGAPGSGIDLVARILAEGLAPRLGHPVTVENRPGAGSVLAVQAHVQARPGESLLLAATGVASTVPYTFDGRLPYDPATDIPPVAIAGNEFLCLAVPAALPVRTLEDFVRHAEARAGALNWFSVPGYVELDTRMMFFRNQLDLTYVAYQGSPAAVLDLVAGRIQFAVLPLTPLLGAVREGRVRALAVTSGARAPQLPDVPTVEEAGFPEQRYDPVTGLFGWRGMPEAIKARLAGFVAEILGETTANERLRRAGMVASTGDAAALAAVIRVQADRVQLAVRTVGLRTGG